MIQKQIKEFGKKSPRLKIDINKSDELPAGTDVVIMTANEYDGIKQNILNLTSQLRTTENKLYAKDDEIAIYKDQEQNLKEIIADAIAPIDKHYQKELSKKDKEINQLQVQLKAMQDKTNQYNLEMQGLNAVDLLIFRKHKKLIKSYNEDIAIIGVDPKIIDADAKAIPGADENAAKDQEQ